MPTPAPTGDQWQISAGDYTATVVETGGGLRELTHRGRPVLAGYDVHATIVAARGQLLLPWPNRIRDGAYEFEGRSLQLPLNEPSLSNASHGLTRWCSWHLLEQDAESVRVGYRLMAQSGYPWTLDLAVEHRLMPEGLTVTVSATNRSSEPAPFAAGMHPYFAPARSVDTAVLHVPASTRLRVDDRLLPTHTEPVDPDHDFRTPRAIGDAVLDDAFTDLERDADGLARCRLGDHVLWMDDRWPWVQLFTADTLEGADRRASVAMEPMTAPADAFNSGQDLVTLAPEGSWTGRFGLGTSG